MFSRTAMLAAMLSSARRLETKPISLRMASAGSAGSIDCAVERDVAGRERDLAEDGAADRVMAGAAQPDEAERLARRDGEGHRPDALGDRILDLEHDAIGRAAPA